MKRKRSRLTTLPSTEETVKKRTYREVFDQGHVLNQAFQIMLSRQDFGLTGMCFLPACVCDY